MSSRRDTIATFSQYASPRPYPPQHSPEQRRHSELPNRHSQFNEHLDPSLSPSSSRTTSSISPESPVLQQRDSVLEPDALATFTSKTAATHRPNIYKPEFPVPLKMTKYSVHDAETGNAKITIARNAVHMPEPFSSKPLLTLSKSDTGAAIGSIRFHFASSAIDLELLGAGKSRMVHDGHFSKRWKFPSFFGREEAVLFWCHSKKEGWELRAGGKKGDVVARIGMVDGLTLKFERSGMKESEVEEVVLSAIAVLEALRRSQKEDDWSEMGDKAKTVPLTI